jgi:hypothetical protein
VNLKIVNIIWCDLKLLWSFLKINTNLHGFENSYVFNNNNITCIVSSCERVPPKAPFKDIWKTFLNFNDDESLELVKTKQL